MPPGFIRFALIHSFSYSFGATAFAEFFYFIFYLFFLFFFTSKHFVSLFYIRLRAW